MAGYSRQETYTTGDVIQADDSNNEFDQLLAAFVNTTGHKHDGTTTEGPVIGVLGDAGVTTPLNKVLIDTSNNYIEFYVDVSSSAVQQMYVSDGALLPTTTNDIDLGADANAFKNLYLSGSIIIEGSTANGYETTIAVTDPTADRTWTIPNSASDTFAGLAATQTFTNKTHTSPVLDGTLTGTAFLDEDTFSSDSAIAVASQQSIKAYIATQISASLTQEEVEDYAGAVVATGGTKTGITVTYQDSTGDMDFVVSSSGLTTAGIVELATITETNTGTDATRAVTPDGLDGWTGSAQVTTLGTIATGAWEGTAINQTYLVGQSGTNTGDEVASSDTVAGVVELATIAETNTGTSTTLAVTPDGLDGWTGSAQVTTLGTIATGVWQGTAINQTYLTGQSGTNTGDESAASLTVAGVIEIATTTETNTGTDETRAVSPVGLTAWTGDTALVTLGTITTGTWSSTDIAVAAGGTGASDAATALSNLGGVGLGIVLALG